MNKAERLRRTENIVRKRIASLKNQYKNINKEIPLCKIGRCRKRHPYDCGYTKCYCCHHDKIEGNLTKQEKISNLHIKEQN